MAFFDKTRRKLFGIFGLTYTSMAASELLNGDGKEASNAPVRVGIMFDGGSVCGANTVGTIKPGWRVIFYFMNTKSLAPVYTNSDLSAVANNPIAADQIGNFPTTYLDSSINYRLQLRDATDAILLDEDPYEASACVANTSLRLLWPRTKAEVAANLIPTDFRSPPPDVRRFGASADAVADDHPSISRATTLAKVGYYDLTLSSWNPDGGYKIAAPITVSYAGHGQVNYKGINIHGPTVIYPTMSDCVFDFRADFTAQQNAKFKLEDAIIVGDGIHFPTTMRTRNLMFGETHSITQFNSGPIVEWAHAGMMRAQNCFASGGTVAFSMDHSHDCYVTECHSYGCNTGFRATGSNNVATDGNICFSNCVSLQNSEVGFYLKGQYTPCLINVIADQSPTGIFVQSCQYGLINGAFVGPSGNHSIHYAYAPGDLGNVSNIVTNVNAQTGMQLERFQSSILSDTNVLSAHGSAPSGATINVEQGAYNIFSGLNLRDNSGSIYEYQQDSASTHNIINGGRYERPIYLKGTKKSRSGRNIVMPNYAPGGVKTDDVVQGQFRTDEYVRYFDGVRINETSFGYLIPYVAASGKLRSNDKIIFDTLTIIPACTTQENVYEAEFIVSGGCVGSTSAAKICVLRSYDGIELTKTGDIGNRGSLSISVETSIISIVNNSVTLPMPYAIRLTKLDGY